MGTTLKSLSENAVRECTFGKRKLVTEVTAEIASKALRRIAGDASPERSLWIAVIEQAIVDAAVVRVPYGRKIKNVAKALHAKAVRENRRRHAIAWAGSKDFVDVCDLAGIDSQTALKIFMAAAKSTTHFDVSL